MSAESTVVRSYIDALLALPWKKRSRVKYDVESASEVLDDQHFGLGDVKERVIEFLAVQSRVKKIQGPVLCLVGPPGVGKTSLGQAIAKATNRKYIRIALGGVRDEAEIRGHRKTYIGSMPGRIIQKITQSGVKNPLILLDEIDKMSSDFRGDPGSALLEVLDPEQNQYFNDHFLEVGFDLSEVMFVCTSNSMEIPAPLLDRMEIIRIPGYTLNEKQSIAENHLIPKQIKQNGLKENEINFDSDAVNYLIRNYTKEAGVRSLDREISKVCRKAVTAITTDKSLSSVDITEAEVKQFCGVEKFTQSKTANESSVGKVTGLAWTSVGGELLTIEAQTYQGKAEMLYTGSLGDVMQESIKAAFTVVKSLAPKFEIDTKVFDDNTVHIHVPEGATPKDGPSAGIAMVCAILSAFSGKKIDSKIAMTGEVTIKGDVLAIGGLKEKLLAALQSGVKKVLIPEENRRHLEEVPEEVLSGLQIVVVDRVEQVLKHALI